MYVEMALPVIDDGNQKRFQKVIEARMPRLEKDSQKKRMAKVLRKLA